MQGRLLVAATAMVAVFLSAASGALAAGSDSWTQWTATPQDTWIRSLDFTAATTLVASSGDGIIRRRRRSARGHRPTTDWRRPVI